MIRSDNVLLVAGQTDDAVRVHVRRMGVEHRLVPDGTELRGAVTVLVAVGRREFRCIPVYVADRPFVSDFSLLAFLDRRSSTLASRARAEPLPPPGLRGAS